MTGYLHPDYIHSLDEFGAPYCLSRSGGWVLEREIPGQAATDAMGAYPLFLCQDWSQLEADLEELGRRCVSLSLVVDPFSEADERCLRQLFPDRVVPFKRHYVVDLTCSPRRSVSAHHRRNIRKAQKQVKVEVCYEAGPHLDEWVALYQGLCRRHNIRGLRCFSRRSFSRQFEVPGLRLMRATVGGEPAGMLLWYTTGEVAYYHLGAFNETGYRCGASFALFWQAMEYFSDLGLRWLNLGGGAGLSGAVGESGLDRFKRGWATGCKTAYFCGRIFDHRRYGEISAATGAGIDNNYFPAYRQGEFN